MLFLLINLLCKKKARKYNRAKQCRLLVIPRCFCRCSCCLYTVSCCCCCCFVTCRSGWCCCENELCLGVFSDLSADPSNGTCWGSLKNGACCWACIELVFSYLQTLMLTKKRWACCSKNPELNGARVVRETRSHIGLFYWREI